MSDDTKICPDCHVTGQHVVTRARRFGEKIEPPKQCPRCGGTGKEPKPVVDALQRGV